MSEPAYLPQPSEEPAYEVEISTQPPDYVVTDEQRWRWHICLRTAQKLARTVGQDSTFVFHTTRELYASDNPTGTREDLNPEQLAEIGEPWSPPVRS